jgi:hypothetical protein
MKKISNVLNYPYLNLLNKYLYNKGLLREEFLINDKKSILIDNKDSLFLISSKFKRQLSFNNNIKLYNYNSKSLNLFSFELNRSYFSNSYKNILINLNRILFVLNKLNIFEKNFYFILIIKPKKGGFLCYYNGILGFLPNYNFFYYAYTFLKNFINFSLKFKFSYLNFNNIRNNSYLKFPISIIKTKIYPLYKKKKIFKYKNKFSTKLNILFG